MTLQGAEGPTPRPHLISSYVHEGELVVVVDPARPRVLRFGASACDVVRSEFASVAEADEFFGRLLVNELLAAPARVAEFWVDRVVLVLVPDQVRGGLHFAGWLPDSEGSLFPLVEYFADQDRAYTAFIDIVEDTAATLRGRI